MERTWKYVIYILKYHVPTITLRKAAAHCHWCISAPKTQKDIIRVPNNHYEPLQPYTTPCLWSHSSYAQVLSATLLVWQLVAGGCATTAGEALLGSVQQPGSKQNTSPSASKSGRMDLTWSCCGLWLMSIYNLTKHLFGDVWNETVCQVAATTILSLEDGEEGDQIQCNSCL